MKKMVLLILAIVVSVSLQAQNCKYLVNKTDEFTGKHTKATQVYLQGSLLTGGSSLLFNYSDTVYSAGFLMMASMYTTDQAKIPEGSTSFFKFTDGKVLSVKNKFGGSNSSYNTVSGGNTMMYIMFDLDRATLIKLSESPIEKIRIGYNADGSVGYDLDINRNKQQGIKQAITCILN